MRFLSRRVYLSALVVLVTALAQGLRTKRRRALGERFGVSARTLSRWRRWWREVFPATRWWQSARGQLLPPPSAEALPGGLLECFGDPAAERALVHTLRWLSPVSVPTG